MAMEQRSIGHAQLRNNLREVLDQVAGAQPVAVTNRNRIEAYLMSSTDFARLHESQEQLERLLAALPIIVAAVRSGVAYPAEALRPLIGTELSVDWRRMNEFQAMFPVEMTHDEFGPVAPSPGMLSHEPFEELDDELVYTAP
jgi:prevent-host-death family protein